MSKSHERQQSHRSNSGDKGEIDEDEGGPQELFLSVSTFTPLLSLPRFSLHPLIGIIASRRSRYVPLNPLLSSFPPFPTPITKSHIIIFRIGHRYQDHDRWPSTCINDSKRVCDHIGIHRSFHPRHHPTLGTFNHRIVSRWDREIQCQIGGLRCYRHAGGH